MNAEGTAVLPARPAARVGLSLDEAAAFLHPPLSRDLLGRLAAGLPGLRPVGTRRTRGRPVPLYDAAELMELHNVLRRWL